MSYRNDPAWCAAQERLCEPPGSHPDERFVESLRAIRELYLIESAGADAA